MKLPDFSVRRPVTVIMIFLGVVLLGVISWGRLPQELFPPLTYPQITVVTSYEGAAPEEVETLITKVIEEAVGTVTNIRRVNSTSKEGLSLVVAEFKWGTNMDFAALNVREKIDLVKERLPRESEEPIVMKYNPFDMPIMTLSVTGDLPPVELRELSRRIIKDEIEKVEGIASAEITGGIEREILVEVDQPRLQASGISLVGVVESLERANINYPAGTIKEPFYEYLIRTMGEFQKVGEIEQIAAGVDEDRPPSGAYARGYPAIGIEEEEELAERPREVGRRRLILLKDIATVKDTTKERDSISRHNGRENISISIRKQSGTNTLRVATGIRRAVERLTRELPKGVKIAVVYDQSTFIKESIKGVRDAAIGGGMLAFFVLLAFLRRFRPSLIVTTAIPISVMAAFGLMHISGITLNMMSLGGLALGVGMLVDNAIVVIESIFRAKGQPKEAARRGASEVSNAIIASTFTTIAVFLPMIFVIGIAGQLFKQLAFTVTFSLLASLAIALSLIPVLVTGGRHQPRKANPQPRLSNNDTIGVNDLTGGLYSKLLSRLLKHKLIILLCILMAFVGGMRLLLGQDREFMPKMDQRQFIVEVAMEPGTRLEVTDLVSRKIEDVLLGLDEVEGVTVNIGSTKAKTPGEALETLGSHEARIMVNLKKAGGRSTRQIIQYLKTALEAEDLEGAKLEYVAQETVLKAAFGEIAPICVEIKGHNLAILADLASRLQSQMATIGGLYGIKNSLIPPAPETKIHILKDRASLYNLSVRDIALTAQIALRGYVATKFKEEGQEIDMRVRLRPADRRDFSKLRRLLIHSPLGIKVPLSEVAYLSKGLGPSEIKRLDQQRAVLITANIFGRSLGEVTEDIERIISAKSGVQNPEFKIPDGYSVSMGGESEQMEESFKSLRFALGLAILLVYMIMAAQFESLWQPFIIIFAIPLSLIGVSLALWITHTSLNVVVLLGFIMLGGIVVNNGIVLVDYVNILRQRGLELHQAVITASQTRLRPILMTTLTTVLALLPLALGFGEGAELRAPLAITVIGGLLVATGLTLIVIPAIYLLFERLISLVAKPVSVPEISAPPEAVVTKAEAPPAVEAEVIRPEPEVIEQKPEVTEQEPEIHRPPPPSPVAEQLNKRQSEVLEYLKENKMISRKDYASIFKVSIPTAARDLKELLDKGLLLAKGPLGPGRWYELREVR